MLLIDAVFVNDGGGKILLDYLMEELEKTATPVYYILDSRLKNKHPKASGEYRYIEGFWKRHVFYLVNRKKFTKVLCFGNVPPSIRLRANVFTYFHQFLFLQVPNDYSVWKKLKFRTKRLIIKRLIGNTDHWLVQTKLVKIKLQKSFGIHDPNVHIVPFYPSLPAKTGDVTRTTNSFLYVSGYHQYKNHNRLINAFVTYFSKSKVGELHLTIPEESHLNTRLKQLSKEYPIFNHGQLDRSELVTLYRSCEYFIYPSLYESFGLGIVEALENGCKIIGADRPYLKAVCEPSLIFDPMSEQSIIDAFNTCCRTEVRSSNQLVTNDIYKLLEMLR